MSVSLYISFLLKVIQGIEPTTSSLPRRCSNHLAPKNFSTTHVFEHHEVVDEEDELALEEIPNGLTSLDLGLRNLATTELLNRKRQL